MLLVNLARFCINDFVYACGFQSELESIDVSNLILVSLTVVATSKISNDFIRREIYLS